MYINNLKFFETLRLFVLFLLFIYLFISLYLKLIVLKRSRYNSTNKNQLIKGGKIGKKIITNLHDKKKKKNKVKSQNRCVYLQILQVQVLAFHFLMLVLNSFRVVEFFISIGRVFHR